LRSVPSASQDLSSNSSSKCTLIWRKLRNAIENFVGTGPDERLINNCPYTPRVRKVLDLAANEARALKKLYANLPAD